MRRTWWRVNAANKKEWRVCRSATFPPVTGNKEVFYHKVIRTESFTSGASMIRSLLRGHLAFIIIFIRRSVCLVAVSRAPLMSKFQDWFVLLVNSPFLLPAPWKMLDSTKDWVMWGPLFHGVLIKMNFTNCVRSPRRPCSTQTLPTSWSQWKCLLHFPHKLIGHDFSSHECMDVMEET